jgi:hypothetical protein
MNVVEFLVKIKDMASNPLQQMGQTGSNSFKKIQQSMDSLTGRGNVLKQSISDINLQIDKLQRTREISLDSSQIQRINKEIDGLQAKKDRLSGSGSRGGLGSFFRQGLAVAGIGSLAFLGKDIMQAGIERQMNLTSLQTLLGTNNGNILNGQLLDYAKRSIYGGEVFNEGKIMAASGIKANNIMPVMSMLGDIGMGNKDRMQSLALAFSEASTRGNLNGMNERMFLQGGLFNPLQQLHLMTGRSMNDLKKDMEKGKIGINELVKAMQYATGPAGKYYQMMQRLQNTPAGKWTAFTGTLRTLAGTIGLELLPALGKLTDFLTGLINNKGELYGIAAAIGAMTVAWGAYKIAVNGASIAEGIAEALAYWPVALVGAIAGAIVYLCTKYESWGNSMKAIWEITKSFLALMKVAFVSFADTITYIFKNLFDNIMNGIDMHILKAAGKFLQGNRKGALKELESIGTTSPEEKRAKELRDKEFKNKMHWNAFDLKFALLDFQKTWDSNINKIHFDTIVNPNAKKGKSAWDNITNALTGNYDFGKTPTADIATSAKDSSAAIAGGGVRNITINVAKFQDKTEIHVMRMAESEKELEDMMENWYLRIVNSAAAQLN